MTYNDVREKMPELTLGNNTESEDVLVVLRKFGFNSDHDYSSSDTHQIASWNGFKWETEADDNIEANANY